MKVKMSPYYENVSACHVGSRTNAHLVSAALKEGIWVHAIGNGVSDDWEPVEDHRRLIWVLEEELVHEVEEDGEGNEGGEARGDNEA
jgi:hypothetical protein